MVGPYEVFIFAVVCIAPIVIILGTLEIVKLAKSRDSGAKYLSGMAIASLIMGIISLFGWLLPVLGFPLSLVGLIMGFASRASSRRRTAITGMILSVIGMLAMVVYIGVSFFLYYD
jgi:hypothetical protein